MSPPKPALPLHLSTVQSFGLKVMLDPHFPVLSVCLPTKPWIYSLRYHPVQTTGIAACNSLV